METGKSLTAPQSVFWQSILKHLDRSIINNTFPRFAGGTTLVSQNMRTRMTNF